MFHLARSVTNRSVAFGWELSEHGKQFWQHNLEQCFCKTEVIAWGSAFSLISVLIVTGNLLTIVLFAVNKKVGKKRFFLVVNMACADLLVGAVSLPIKIITPLLREVRISLPVATFLNIVTVVCLQATITFAALISLERLYATCWPLKHRTLSGRAYNVVIILAWILVLLSSAILSVLRVFVSKVAYYSFWVTYTLPSHSLFAFVLSAFGENLKTGVSRHWHNKTELYRADAWRRPWCSYLISYLIS